MSQTNYLKEIESKYPVSNIEANNLKIWPLLRHMVYFKLLKKETSYSSKLRTRNKLQIFKNFFFGIEKLFRIRRFSYIFFNNTDKRVQINNKYFDIFFDEIADKVGQEKSLFIEWAIEKHKPQKLNHSKNIISDLPFKTFCFLFKILIKTKIIDENVLDELESDMQITFNFKQEIKSTLGEILFYKFLFKIINPKTVFLISSSSKASIVLAARLQGIKVIEAQHGYIGRNHPFYYSNVKFDNIYYPNELLAFGSFEKERSDPSFIFESDKIFPVGSFYPEHINKNFESKEIINICKGYEKVFCVTLQSIFEDDLLDWIKAQANKNKKWLFILRPRDPNNDYSSYLEYTNIILCPKYNIYQVLKYSDYNITIFSTTAVEGEIFDAKTIFFNINNLSKKYFTSSEIDAVFIEPNEKLLVKDLFYENNVQNRYFTSNYLKHIATLNLNL